MRRMREWYFEISVAVGAILVLGAGIGIYRYRKNHHHPSVHTKSNTEEIQTLPSQALEPKETPAEHAAKPGKKSVSQVFTSFLHREKPKKQEPIHPEEASPSSSFVYKKGFCHPVEYQGDGFQNTHISAEQWKKLVGEFHQAKQQLEVWVKSGSYPLSDKAKLYMQHQLHELKLIHPPTTDEPDLNWRGIGVWTRDEKDNVSIRLNSGFVKWALKDPKRTQFEMTRLVAQSWAPCEMERIGEASMWKDLLQCLEVKEAQGCADASFSEAGWAVSTGLAEVISPVGCTVPAFESSKKMACLKQISLNSKNRKISAVESKPKSKAKPKAKKKGHK